MTRKARRASQRAYCRYSKFRVGAAVLLEDGRMFSGTNIENASYRLTICAENSAISSAIMEAGPKIRLKAVAVANLNGAASMPCGACRQILLEFGSNATWIFAPGEDGPVEVTLGEILPYGFSLRDE